MDEVTISECYLKSIWNSHHNSFEMEFPFSTIIPVFRVQLALRVHSDIRTASGFVITTEPLGFVLTKEVNVFLLRVLLPLDHCNVFTPLADNSDEKQHSPDGLTIQLGIPI